MFIFRRGVLIIPGMLILVFVLVLKDSLRTYFKSLSLSWSLGSGPCPYPYPWGVRSRRSLSLSWSLRVRSWSLSWFLGVRSLSLSWSLGVRSLLTSLAVCCSVSSSSSIPFSLRTLSLVFFSVHDFLCIFLHIRISHALIFFPFSRLRSHTELSGKSVSLLSFFRVYAHVFV